MAQGYNMRSPAVKRLMREALELKDKNEQFFAQPLEDNLFEWHFTIRGPADSEFEGGIYHGRIILPAEYPMKPPSIILLTPSGRFETNKKICLSISGYHPESWQPSWSLRTAMLAIIGFMTTHGNGAIGSLDYSQEERIILAKKSLDWKCPHCGNICDLVLPVTEASQKLTKEAKELGAQINLEGEKPKLENNKNEAIKSNVQPASTSSSLNYNSASCSQTIPSQNNSLPLNPQTMPPQFPQFPFSQNMHFPTQLLPQFTPLQNYDINQVQTNPCFYPFSQFNMFNPMAGFVPRQPIDEHVGNFHPYPQFPPFLPNAFPHNFNQQMMPNFIQNNGNGIFSNAAIPISTITEIKPVSVTTDKISSLISMAATKPPSSNEENISIEPGTSDLKSTVGKTKGDTLMAVKQASNTLNSNENKTEEILDNTRLNKDPHSKLKSTLMNQDNNKINCEQENVSKQLSTTAETSSGTSQTSEQITRAASAQALLQNLRQRLVVPPSDEPRPTAPSTNQRPINSFLSMLTSAFLDAVVLFFVFCIVVLMIRRMYLTFNELE